MCEQITIDEIVGKKDKDILTPAVWDCMKTCSNFSAILPDGSIDYFPCTHEKRCVNMDFKSKLVNNYWITHCNNYKRGGNR